MIYRVEWNQIYAFFDKYGLGWILEEELLVLLIAMK
jgi:hypothetical protein